MMPKLWSRVFTLVCMATAAIICLEIYSINDPNTSTERKKYDANHMKLLKAYSSNRHKKVRYANKQLMISNDTRTYELGDDRISSIIPKFKPRGIALQLPDFPVDTPHQTNTRDVFIAVKTTGKYHQSRMSVLLETWIPLARQSVSPLTSPSLSAILIS